MILSGVALVQHSAFACSGHQCVAVKVALGSVAVKYREADVVGKLERITAHVGAAHFVGKVDAESVLKRQRACIADLQHCILHVTGLPQSTFFEHRRILVGLLECLGCAVLIRQLDVQIACDNFVNAGRRSIGKPRKCSADKH